MIKRIITKLIFIKKAMQLLLHKNDTPRECISEYET